jgi:hypothetical protein
MNRYALSSEEREVFDQIATLVGNLPTASQYKVLVKLGHEMDRDIVRKGSLRAAAAVAGSTARVLAEGQNVKKASSKSSKTGKPKGYPRAFVEGVGRPLLAAQRLARDELSSPPTAEERERLREASEAVRDGFRRFKEAQGN